MWQDGVQGPACRIRVLTAVVPPRSGSGMKMFINREVRSEIVTGPVLYCPKCPHAVKFVVAATLPSCRSARFD